MVPCSLHEMHLDLHHLLILSSLHLKTSSSQCCAHPAYLRNLLCFSSHCYLLANVVKKQTNMQRKLYPSGHLSSPISAHNFVFAAPCYQIKKCLLSVNPSVVSTFLPWTWLKPVIPNLFRQSDQSS